MRRGACTIRRGRQPARCYRGTRRSFRPADARALDRCRVRQAVRRRRRAANSGAWCRPSASPGRLGRSTRFLRASAWRLLLDASALVPGTVLHPILDVKGVIGLPRAMVLTRDGASVDRAVADLRGRILRGELTPGEQLRQEQLADAVGVSRIPLREALRALAVQGLLEHRPHQGY